MARVENNCKCHAIYKEHGHIKQRARKQLLGSKHQFCAAFYHVHEWYHPQERLYREHFCLDEDNCIMAKKEKVYIKKFAQDAKEFAKIAKEFADKTGQPEGTTESLEKEAELLDEEANEFVEKVGRFAVTAKSFEEEFAKKGTKIQKKSEPTCRESKECCLRMV